MAARDAAITGLGMTSLGRVYGSSPRRLAASAVRLAATDAGIELSDVDGLLICPGITGGLDLGLAGLLGSGRDRWHCARRGLRLRRHPAA